MQRKVVTVFFSDLVGSTELGEKLDPEALRRLLARYFEEVRDVLERHGGTLEKYIGDAVVAVFGIPAAREDDALRALRAAAEIRERLEALNEEFDRDFGVRLGVRTGIHTGEVVVGPDVGGTSLTASGDTMNVAARLEQSADAGEILIGLATRALGGDAIVVEEVEPLALRGKAAPVEAFRLVQVLPHAAPYGRREDVPLVGRQRELAALRAALARAEGNAECVLVTIIGSAGVGKSRLAREFLAPLDDRVRVLVGRCPAYGEGITFLPLADAVAEVLGSDPHRQILELLAGDERAQLVAERLGLVMGASEGGGSAEEVFWAVRRLLEGLATKRPVVLVLDDIHWAEPTLLDLVEYVATFSRGAPLLLLCLARPELLEVRPTWAAPRESSTLAMLGPLEDDESLVLVGSLTPGDDFAEADLRRIVDAADGNPLFLEQLLALNTGGERRSELVIPPTIQALLQARIDRLDEGEWAVLERAAIEGREFRRDTVVELLPAASRSEVGANLLALARRQFIRPLRGRDPGDDTFAFSHALVRDAAYTAIPKEVRADLHVRLADYLGKRSDTPVEILGQHLAEAARYRLELGQDDERTHEIAEHGARLLAAGGQRALGLGDDRAAARLLERAAGLVSTEDPLGRSVRGELGRALTGTGDLERSRAVFSELRDAARDSSERVLELRAELGLANLRVQTDPTMSNAELAAVAERAIPVFEAEADEYGLARSWFLIHWAQFRAGRFTNSIGPAEEVIRHSARAGETREQLRALGAIAMAHLWGQTPVEEMEQRLDELVERSGGARLMEAFAYRVRGGLCSLTGDFERGREHYRCAVEIHHEFGHRLSAIAVAVELELLERKAGRLAIAERELRSAYERAEELGDVYYVSWVGVTLARVLAEQNKFDEAVELARVCRDELQRDIAYAQIVSRLVEAAALSAESRMTDAETRALEALALVEDTDILDLNGDVLLALADLDLAAGRSNRAGRRVATAIALYDRKGDVVSAERARARAVPLGA